MVIRAHRESRDAYLSFLAQEDLDYICKPRHTPIMIDPPIGPESVCKSSTTTICLPPFVVMSKKMLWVGASVSRQRLEINSPSSESVKSDLVNQGKPTSPYFLMFSYTYADARITLVTTSMSSLT